MCERVWLYILPAQKQVTWPRCRRAPPTGKHHGTTHIHTHPQLTVLHWPVRYTARSMPCKLSWWYVTPHSSTHLSERGRGAQLSEDDEQGLHEGLEHRHHVLRGREDEPRQGEVKRRPLPDVRGGSLHVNTETTNTTKNDGENILKLIPFSFLFSNIFLAIVWLFLLKIIKIQMNVGW